MRFIETCEIKSDVTYGCSPGKYCLIPRYDLRRAQPMGAWILWRAILATELNRSRAQSSFDRLLETSKLARLHCRQRSILRTRPRLRPSFIVSRADSRQG